MQTGNNPLRDEVTVIDSGAKILGFGLGGLFRYRQLVRLFVRRNFVTQYKQTVLGPLWLVITPLATSLIFTVVFGQLVGVTTDGIPQFLFFLSGYSFWNMFNTGVVNVAATFTQNSAVFGKVYFPRLTVPVAQVITSAINFSIQLAIFAVFYIAEIAGSGAAYLSFRLLLVPVLAFQCVLLALGVGLIIASLTVRYKDLLMAINFGMLLWMYMSPVLYSIPASGGLPGLLFLLNPMSPILHHFRYALFSGQLFYGGPWAVSFGTTAALLVTGILLFNKQSKTFLDTI